jgi:hypothetical protein
VYAHFYGPSRLRHLGPSFRRWGLCTAYFWLLLPRNNVGKVCCLFKELLPSPDHFTGSVSVAHSFIVAFI